MVQDVTYNKPWLKMSLVEFDPQIDIRRIKYSRAQIKGELTCFQKFFNKTHLEQSLNILQVRCEVIKPLLEKFKADQTEYEDLLLNNCPDDYNENEMFAER
ncbi:unnamed protein product [Acanthoscelides obtectus]|uniref:Uncharacterized protein n=1 Tax=Acanthoscelides obtectus TaxID=200917 RepID=A0A9P0PRH6_ACAOB|nr:unnamed protein product [Acanthoscelides obtectus]CAK1656770.1 hypothetical protein AOBTE_LOCUS19904 [Acanthoscelides obtectus]